MKSLKSKGRRPVFRKPVLLIVALMSCAPAWCGSASGGDVVLTKNLWGGHGTANVTSGDTALGFVGGETAAGTRMTNGDMELVSGYLAGFFNGGQTFSLVRYSIGSRPVYQDSVQVGVPLNASVELTFSATIALPSVSSAVFIVSTLDHLGRARSVPMTFTTAYDVAASKLTLTPDQPWDANSLYDVVLTPSLQSVDGFSLNGEKHIPFVTVLDPKQENVVLHPLPMPVLEAAALPVTSEPVLQVALPAESLADYSMVLITNDPLHSPLRANPEVIRDATERAIAHGGGYRSPVSLREISAYDLQGKAVTRLSKPASLTLAMNATQGQGAGAPSNATRPGTVALWTLDEAHRLWVKLPGSTLSDAGAVNASASALSVFAIMGAPSTSAADAYVFPIPWRPNGPNAGMGPGQTGTDADGMTFSSLPSECRIKIYTLSGDLVRDLRHSDVAGSLAQEKWDGRTAGGERAASGVYLWRVESESDSKNGKLMIIR